MAQQNKYDRTHQRRLNAYLRAVDEIYRETAREAAAIGVSIDDFNPEKLFSFADYPRTKQRLDKLLEELRDNLSAMIVNGIKSEWTLANNKNNELCRQVFGDNVGKLTQAQYRRYFSTNGAARDAFLGRKEAGLKLSDRVWNYTNQFKEEIELGLDIGIRSGLSAQKLAKQLQVFLKNPDKLFRRVRDEHGQLQLSKRAAAYHPGRGVYRSSYKNARRLAATECNMAYRTADHERWQQLDFVVGILIEPSKTNHPVPDICDDLAGKYPKDFKWTGWHPHCRCHALSILKTMDEIEADTQRILRGEEPTEGSENEVKDLPDNFKQWVVDNRERTARASSMPYFLRDNQTLIQAQSTPRLTVEQLREQRRAARSLDDLRRIQDYADSRTYGQQWVDSIHGLEQSLGVERGLRMSFEDADKQNANPNYGKGKEYSINCQTCAPAYALRLMGFDVTAKGNTRNSLLDALSRQQSLLAWNNPDGSVAPYTNLHTWMAAKNYKQMSKARYLEFWEASTQETGVYIFTINWKGGGAHTSILQRFEDGTLRYIEPQCDNSSKSIKDELEELASKGSVKPKGRRGIIRVDDKIFSSKWAKIFNVRKRHK